jgi:hypothetical protein
MRGGFEVANFIQFLTAHHAGHNNSGFVPNKFGLVRFEFPGKIAMQTDLFVGQLVNGIIAPPVGFAKHRVG